MQTTTKRAKELRKNLTEAETLLWSLLRTLPHAKFRRQVPLGAYIVDFACLSHSLVVEVDGGQHANNPADRTRDEWLQAQGFQVLRFWNHDVLGHRDAVGEAILRALAQKAEL